MSFSKGPVTVPIFMVRRLRSPVVRGVNARWEHRTDLRARREVPPRAFELCVAGIDGRRMDRIAEAELFVAVVDAHGFAAAARKLGRSQPAVSRGLAALESR